MKKILFLLVCVFSLVLLASSAFAVYCCEKAGHCYTTIGPEECAEGYSQYNSPPYSCSGNQCLSEAPEFSSVGVVVAVIAIIAISAILLRKYGKKK